MKPARTKQIARAIAPYLATIVSVSLAVTLRVEHSCSDAQGPASPTFTPPGARTSAMVTPSMIRSGARNGAAPALNARAYASCASETWTVKLLPGASPGDVRRIPPPP